ncbi:MAG: glycosyltransferase, partial [Runella slithyformis]
ILKSKGIDAEFQFLGAIEPDKGLGISAEQMEAWQKEGLMTYLGRVSDVRPMIEDADCVVLPSYREGTPRTLLEAASMSKSIITTDVAGCRETVEDGANGFLCEPQNAEDLANKMLKIKVTEVDK